MTTSKSTSSEKIRLFRNLFSGLTIAYGTYDPDSGKASQRKEKVTDKVLLSHLKGLQPYGVYLLVKDKTRAIAVDFDTQSKIAPMSFRDCANHYRLSSYIECSKSKGYHVWIFFEERGVLARKARLVVRHILEEIEAPDTEIFPKQDSLNAPNVSYGNFINAPLFGTLVLFGKTVFVDPATFDPYPDQWEFLDSVERHNESVLDDIIELNDLSPRPEKASPRPSPLQPGLNSYSLPPCARIMLQDGVTKNQRCCCFRLAVHLKRMGIPFDGAVALLKYWAEKNKPEDINKGVIAEKEIFAQVSDAFRRSYSSYGCDKEEIKPFCQPDCPLNLAKINSRLTGNRI